MGQTPDVKLSSAFIIKTDLNDPEYKSGHHVLAKVIGNHIQETTVVQYFSFYFPYSN